MMIHIIKLLSYHRPKKLDWNRLDIFNYRVEMTLSCEMKLQNYPLDRQLCPMKIESCE